MFSFESLTGLPEFVGYALVFVFGALVGSFLNVVIHRVPLELSVVFPNSKCPKCDNAIKPYDNIPVISWLILGGRCRACKAPISARYPAVEFLHASLWLLVVWQMGFTPYLPVGLIFFSVALALMFIDAEHMILPNVITYPFFVFAIVVRVLYPLTFGSQYFPDMQSFPAVAMQGNPEWFVSLVSGLVGGIVAGGSLWLVGEIWKRFRGIDAMGLGDVKMMLGFGALLGWQLSFLAIFFGAFAGAVIGAVAIARQKEEGMQAQIPFGIFLGIGSIIALLFGNPLVDWYFATFVP